MKCIDDMVAELTANSKIRIERNEMSFPDLGEAVTKKFYKYQHPQWVALRELWMLLRGSNLLWTYNSELENGLPGGEFFIDHRSASVVFELENKAKMLAQNPEFSEKDTILNIGTNRWNRSNNDAVIQIVTSNSTTQMWLYVAQTEWAKLDLNFEQYVYAMCHFKCRNEWEFYFVNEKYLEVIGSQFLAETCAHNDEVLKYLFPELDLSKRDF